MTAKSKMLVIVGLTFGAAFSLTGWARVPPGDGPSYTNGTTLVLPADYREWPFLGAGLGLGLGLTYDSPGDSQSAPSFTNVFVSNRAAVA